MTDAVCELSEVEERFINDAKSLKSLRFVVTCLALIFVLLGVYLSIWSAEVLGHVDTAFFHGKFLVMLRDSQAHYATTDVERLQQVLVQQAFTRFIPTLFSVLGACALLWGVSLWLFVRFQVRWLEIVNKLEQKNRFGKSEK